jgi:hypothetical protein
MADELAFKREAVAEYDSAVSLVSAHFVPALLRIPGSSGPAFR